MGKNHMVEITVLSRGGQGGILGNKLLGTVAFADGFRDVTAIPIIGAERRGAPITAYLRISNEPIRRIDAVKKPDYVLVLDETLLRYPAIFSSIQETTVIVNSENGRAYIFPRGVSVFAVPATRIAIDLNLRVAGQPVINVAMIGAFAKVSGLVTLPSIQKVMDGYFGKKGTVNYQAALEAFELTQEVRQDG
jgi:2-oxoacid:acceptor oxidoreductase gamma subunit (pyruvate/2-ketoisovalerate family)